MEFAKFKVGDKVSSLRKDYKFDGEVRASFKTLAGDIKYVVEELNIHVLHIYNTSDIDFTVLIRTPKVTEETKVEDNV